LGSSIQHMILLGIFHIQIIMFHHWPLNTHDNLIMKNVFSPSPRSQNA
jgi:hypothetical protein